MIIFFKQMHFTGPLQFFWAFFFSFTYTSKVVKMREQGTKYIDNNLCYSYI